MTVVVIALAFFVTEQNLINIEFRRQTYSLTFAGVPLALGILLLPVHELVLARLVGGLAALLLQHIAAEKTIYNTAAYAFEAALSGMIVHLWLPHAEVLGLWTIAGLLVAIATVDQLMAVLVLLVIRMHGGDLSRRDVAEVMVQSLVLSLVATVFAAVLQLLMSHGIVGNLLALALVTAAVSIYRAYASSSRRQQSLAAVHDFVTEVVGAETVEQLARRGLA